MRKLALLLPLILLIPYASANAGIPVIFPSYHHMLIALIPVIILEAFIFRRYLDRSFWNLLVPVTVANIVSTTAGLPLSWLLGYGFRMIGGSCLSTEAGQSMFNLFIESAWACKDLIYWLLPIAIIIGLFVAYIVSAYIEHWVMNLWYQVPRKVTYITNAISYEALIGLAVTFLVYGLLTQ
jgi:hypothetical protein